MEAAASDPFFLDWGSSVNVNEDLRRTIRTEIEVIETEVNSLQSNVRAEEKTSAQLTRDFAHARVELMNLSRGATDDRDNSIMNEQIQMRLKDSLMMEVVSVITPPSSPDDKTTSTSIGLDSSSSPDQQLSPITTQESNGNGNRNRNGNSTERHLGKYLSKCADEVKSLTTSMKRKKMNLEDSKSKLSSIQYQINNIDNQINKDKKTQDTWNDDVDEKRRGLDIEKQRFRCVKNAIQRARKLNGHHAQQLANDAKTLSSHKAQNADIELKYDMKKKSMEENLRHFSTELSTTVNTDSELSSQLDSITKQFAVRKEIVAARVKVQQLCKDTKDRIGDIRKREGELLKELSELKEIMKEKDVHLQDCKRQKMEIEQLKATNDKEEKEVLAPAERCLPQLLEEKQALAKKITELHDCSVSEKEIFDTKKKSNTSILNNLNVIYEEKFEHVQVKKKEITDMKNLMEKLHTSTIEEIKEHDQITANLDEALNAQKVLVEEKKMEREEKIEASKLEWSNALKLKNYEVQVLKNGADIIKKTKEIENTLAEERMTSS